VSWTEPRWLILAAAAAAALPGAWVVARARVRQQDRLASRPLWLRWVGGLPATGGLRLALWLLAAAVAGVAAAGPRWGAPARAQAGELDVVIALDVSDSMACTDVPPDRLTRAVRVLRQTIDRVQGAAWGLAVGGGDARPLVPLTLDAATLEERLSDAGLRRWVARGSNLAALLATAGSLLPAAGPGRVILLVSDGEELEGDAASMAASLRRAGIAVVPLLSGTTSGAPVPRPGENGGIVYARDATGALARSRAHPELLRALAGDPAGPVDASSAAAPRLLAEALERAVRSSAREAAPVHARGFVLMAAALATASFLLSPWRRAALGAVLLPAALAGAAPAAPGPSLWARLLPGSASLLARDGQRAAARGAWDEAARAYGRALLANPGDPSLRLGLATAQARLGEGAGERALEELAASPSLAYPAWFNLGTARLLRGDLTGAVHALRQAVAADPSRGGAWHNLELALNGLRRKRAGSAPPTTGEARSRLVDEAARAALQPLVVHGLPQPESPPGRDW
jgi:Ca-activated chloride channel family protein